MILALLISGTCNVILAYYHYRLIIQHHQNINEICRINVYLDSYEKQISRLERILEDYRDGSNEHNKK